MNFNDFINQFLGANTFTLFFKVFSVVFSFLYLVYALVIYKQTQVMARSFITQQNSLILMISLIQIIVGLALLFFSALVL